MTVPKVESVGAVERRGPLLLARAEQPWGTLVLLHEGFGLNGFLREQLVRFSQAGLTCVAPALFWRSGVESVGYLDEAQAAALARAARPDDLLSDLLQARSALLELAPGLTGKMPVMLAGWCFGAAAACLAAWLTNAFDAVVAWYPVRIAAAREAAASLGASDRVRCPTLVFMGENDCFLSDADRALLPEWRIRDGGLTFRSIADADHGFANPDRSHLYSAAAAQATFEEALAFLHRQARLKEVAACG